MKDTTNKNGIILLITAGLIIEFLSLIIGFIVLLFAPVIGLIMAIRAILLIGLYIYASAKIRSNQPNLINAIIILISNLIAGVAFIVMLNPLGFISALVGIISGVAMLVTMPDETKTKYSKESIEYQLEELRKLYDHGHIREIEYEVRRKTLIGKQVLVVRTKEIIEDDLEKLKRKLLSGQTSPINYQQKKQELLKELDQVNQ